MRGARRDLELVRGALAKRRDDEPAALLVLQRLRVIDIHTHT
jgi:hypothetical protein